MKETLCIRADATPQIGTGHVMRCIALAQAWQVQGGVVHLIGRVTPALQTRLTREDIIYHTLDTEPGSKEDVHETNAKARQHNAQWVVVDGYQFGADYQKQVKEHDLKVLFIDDYGHVDYCCADLVLNQNIDAKEALYSERSQDTTLLLGPSYALLRKEFWPWRSLRRAPQDEVNNILVTLGGSDPANVTAQVLSALRALRANNVQVTVAVGGSCSNYDQLAAIAEQSPVPIHLRRDVENMAELMSSMDLAISAGGSTCWELAFMGIPNVIIVLADNQRGIANGLDAAGTSINLGWYEAVKEADIADSLRSLLHDHKQRLQMARRGQKLVDGRGAERILHSGLLQTRKSV